MVEQHEAAYEELQSANEEIQSTNEELQSINEELETSKEEIQSSNEELRTVNDELHDRIAELSRVNNDLNNLLVNVQVAIVIVGADLKVRRLNTSAERLLNLGASDVGRPLGDVPLAIKLPNLDRMLTEVMDTVAAKEVEVQDHEGRWHLLRIRPYKTMDKRIDGAVVMLVDVDAQKRRGLEVQEAREYSETIVSMVREPLVVLDGQFLVHTASAAFCAEFSVSCSDVEGRSFFEIAAGEWHIPELQRALQQVVANGVSAKGIRIEHDFQRHGHRTLLFDVQVIHRKVMPGPLLLIAIEDVAERVQLESDLQARIDELAAADRSKNEFLAMLAHELRNPLAPIANAAYLLKDPSSAETGERARATIERQVVNMKRMIEDLLDASRVSRGMVRLQKQPVDLSTLLPRAVEMARLSRPGSNVEIACVVPEYPVYVDGDPTRLEQVFGNLLSNAIKFSKEEGHIAAILAMGTRADGSPEAVVRVRDDGAGIAPDMLPRVFDLFAQADRSLERKKGGLGIGLTLVRHIVELHGGSVDAHSAGLDQGAEFVVRLPRVESDAPAPHPPDEGVQRAVTPLRILVVDDHADGANSLQMVLARFGHEVRVAPDGAKALTAVKTFRPDVAIIDIGLPTMSGYEVARRLRTLPTTRDATLIALTGYGQDEDRRRALEAGFDHHLTKPVQPLDLRRLLASVDRPRR